MSHVCLPDMTAPWKKMEMCGSLHIITKKTQHKPLSFNSGSMNQHYIFEGYIMVMTKFHKGCGLRKLLGLLQVQWAEKQKVSFQHMLNKCQRKVTHQAGKAFECLALRQQNSWPKYLYDKVYIAQKILLKESRQAIKYWKWRTVRKGYFNFILSWSGYERWDTLIAKCGNKQKCTI